VIVIVVCELKIENDFEIKKENNNTTNDNLPNLLDVLRNKQQGKILHNLICSIVKIYFRYRIILLFYI